MFEIYEGRTEKQNRKKTYIVATEPNMDYWQMIPYAKKFFRCSEAHIEIINGWILNDELFLDDPHKKGAKKRIIAFYV